MIAVVFAGLLCLVPAAALGAATDTAAPATGWSTLNRAVAATDGGSSVENLSLSEDLVPLLLGSRVDEPLMFTDWPVAPGRRAEVRIARHEIYAVGAALYKVEGTRRNEIPRSKLVFLWGETMDAEQARVVVIADPETRTLRGHALTDRGWMDLRPGEDGLDRYRLEPRETSLESLPARPEFACGEETLPVETAERQAPAAVEATAASADTLTSFRTATIAVDTDNELMQLKFSDNTTSAANYVASLFALMSAVYERDLQVRTLQGTTFFRVSTTPDPYTQSGTGNADSAKLSEFKSYWMSNNGGVQRALAMMLSGKQGNVYAASGIAYVDTLCSSSGGYSFSQVLKYPGSAAASDLLVVAHEVGHNFGSLHTHCYLTPTPIDTCYSGEGGCYSGATSCPAAATYSGIPNVRGTLMSYCHLLAGCSSTEVFHPRIITILMPLVADAVGRCVFPDANSCSGKPDGSACDDGNACTRTDTCRSGACTGSNQVNCTATACRDAGTCDTTTGQCNGQPKPDGTACSDGNACTQTDTCLGGTCTGTNPVVCPPPAPCHDAGTCSSATGLCSNPVQPNRTSCEDGDACTQADTCQAGECIPGIPVVCAPLDQCHDLGTCNPSTGVCSSPAKPDGNACDDGDPCTITDTCVAGTCVGSGSAPDTDGDGVCDPGDDCPAISNPEQLDADRDGVGDVCDNCPTTENPDQLDWDHDGLGNACETDLVPMTPWEGAVFVAASAPPAFTWGTGGLGLFKVEWSSADTFAKGTVVASAGWTRNKATLTPSATLWKKILKLGLADGTVRWRIRAKAGTTVSSTEPQRFLLGANETVTVTMPPPGGSYSASGSPPFFTWLGSGYASIKVVFSVFDDLRAPRVVFGGPNPAEVRYFAPDTRQWKSVYNAIAKMSPGGMVYFAVEAKDAIGRVTRSEVQGFTMTP